MRLVVGEDAVVAAWVAARIPHMARNGLDFGPCAAIGVVSETGEPLGGVVYHNYRPHCADIELSFASASPKWLTRPLIRGLMAYPFDQVGCQRVTGVTPKRAKEARAFLDKFGFKREGVVRFGFGDDHAIISGLLRKEWEQSPWARARSAEPAQPAPMMA